MVLTESTALLVFGEENPIGKTIQYRRRSRQVSFTVTGVIYDPPSNSQFQPKYISHMQSIQGIYGEQYRGWVDQNPRPGYVFTYLKLKDESVVSTITSDLQGIWDQVLPDRSDKIKPLLTPLLDIHFQPPIKWERDTPIDMSYIYGLGGIARLRLDHRTYQFCEPDHCSTFQEVQGNWTA